VAVAGADAVGVAADLMGIQRSTRLSAQARDAVINDGTETSLVVRVHTFDVTFRNANCTLALEFSVAPQASLSVRRVWPHMIRKEQMCDDSVASTAAEQFYSLAM
jgi:hypothetical protein